MSSTNTHSHRDKYPGTFVFVFVFAFTSGCDLQITPTTLIYPRISMQCRNGSESRHLINMPFIWPLHTSLKQEPLLQHRQHREPGCSRCRRTAACCLSKLRILAPWPQSAASKNYAARLPLPRLPLLLLDCPLTALVCTACKSWPFVYPFVLIYLHVICFAFACSVSVFRALCAGTVTFARTPVTYDCCVHYQYALCE